MRAASLRTAQFQELLARAELALPYVGAARKGAAVAAQDRNLRFVVHVKAMQLRAQRAHQLIAESVELLRPIESDRDDLAVTFISHQSHRFLLSSFGPC